MKYSQANSGRTFVIRLEDGDILHEQIEAFAHKENIMAAELSALGGADRGSVLVVGPEQGRAQQIVPQTRELDDVYEVTGTGTIFPDSTGQPMLHMHLACGRDGKTITGCVRSGVKVWHVMEVIVRELTDTTGCRKKDAATGFELLNP